MVKLISISACLPETDKGILQTTYGLDLILLGSFLFFCILVSVLPFVSLFEGRVVGFALFQFYIVRKFLNASRDFVLVHVPSVTEFEASL